MGFEVQSLHVIDRRGKPVMCWLVFSTVSSPCIPNSELNNDL